MWSTPCSPATTWAPRRVDELKQCPGFGSTFEVVHRTVPGFKDLAVECKRIIEGEGCLIVVALGMPGKADIDQVCAHEASQGIMQAQLMTSTHILEVFVHENEEEDPAKLAAVCVDRARKHARNAYWMLYEPEQLTRRAGQGVRQGYGDAGPDRWAEPRSAQAGGSWGRPRVRSAMMLRCTSAVPPPMVRAGAKRIPVAPRPPGPGAGPGQVASPPIARTVGGPAPGEHAPGTGQVAGQRHHVLTVLVGQRLAHRRLGTGLHAGNGRRHGPQSQQPQDLTLRPHAGQALADQGIGAHRRTVAPHRPGRRPSDPSPTGRRPRQGDPLVGQGHLGQTTSPGRGHRPGCRPAAAPRRERPR